MSSRSSSKLGRLVSKTRSPGQISRKLCYNHFELWSECLPWSVLDQALKVLCCSGERYRVIMALLSYFFQATIFDNLYEMSIWHLGVLFFAKLQSAVGRVSDCRSRGRKFESQLSHIIFMEIPKITMISSQSPLPLIKKGSSQLLAKVCAQELINRLMDWTCPGKIWVDQLIGSTWP